jgi:hypothetical protein
MPPIGDTVPGAPAIDVAALHDTAARQFDWARREHGELERRMLVGGQVVRFRFAGQKLDAALTPAIGHLECDAPGPRSHLAIDVWQCSQAPIELPKEAWERAVSPSLALGSHDFVYCQPDIGMVILFRGNRALVCYRNIDESPPWELAIPFRIVLNSWFQRFGGQIIHGAAVGDEHHAVILAGAGGAGKSSTALSCLGHPGLYYLSDDLCLLRDAGGGPGDRAEPLPEAGSTANNGSGRRAGAPAAIPPVDAAPVVFSLYNSIKIRRESLAQFAGMHLSHLEHLPLDRGKPTFFLYPRHRERLARERPVCAVLLPRITHRPETRTRPASPRDAWRVLIPSTFAVVMGERKTAARNMFRLTGNLPVYWLDLGVDRRQIADTIHAFLGSFPGKAG